MSFLESSREDVVDCFWSSSCRLLCDAKAAIHIPYPAVEIKEAHDFPESVICIMLIYKSQKKRDLLQARDVSGLATLFECSYIAGIHVFPIY